MTSNAPPTYYLSQFDYCATIQISTVPLSCLSNGWIAQSVEHLTRLQKWLGSSPSPSDVFIGCCGFSAMVNISFTKRKYFQIFSIKGNYQNVVDITGIISKGYDLTIFRQFGVLPRIKGQ